MDTKLKDKVCIVTGGASGIGKATLKLLLEEGAKVVFIDKDAEKARGFSEELIDEDHLDYLYIFGDLTNPDFCKEAVTRTIQKYGGIDVLINNAGKNDFLEIDNTSPQQFRESLDGNLVHYYSMSHCAWPHLKKSKGNIVFIGSKVALVGEGGTIAYAAAKGGIMAMTRELAAKSTKENLGIRVNCVLPGIVHTPLYEVFLKRTYPSLEEGLKQFGKRIPLEQRATTPEEVANSIVFLASPLSSHTTAQFLIPDGGYSHIDRAVTGDYS